MKSKNKELENIDSNKDIENTKNLEQLVNSQLKKIDEDIEIESKNIITEEPKEIINDDKMDEQLKRDYKEASRTPLIVTILFLICIIAGLITYIVYYDKILKFDNSSEKEYKSENRENRDEPIPKEDEKEKTNDDEIEVLIFSEKSLCINKNGEIYIGLYDDNSYIESIYGKEIIDTYEITKSTYSNYAIGDISLKIGLEELKYSKIEISDVEKVAEIRGKNPGLVFIKKDGRVSIISLYSLINGSRSTMKLNGIEEVYDIEVNEDKYILKSKSKDIDLLEYIPKNNKGW